MLILQDIISSLAFFFSGNIVGFWRNPKQSKVLRIITLLPMILIAAFLTFVCYVIGFRFWDWQFWLMAFISLVFWWVAFYFLLVICFNRKSNE